MSLQDAGLWFGIVGGVAGAIAVLFTTVDSIRKRRKLSLDQAGVVTTTAIQLVERLENRTQDLEDQLDGMATKLRDANTRADELERQHGAMASQLADAQAEVRVLRRQVKSLSAELERLGGEPGTTTSLP
jgi:chromosome segregation ATPase